MSEPTDTRLLWYLVTCETTIIVMVASWFFSVYPTIATKSWVRVYAPYSTDRPMIVRHISGTKATLDEVLRGMRKLHDNLVEQGHETELRIQALESKLGQKG